MSKPLYKLLQETLNTGKLLEIVDNVLAASQVLSKLGYSNKGQYVLIVRQFLLDNEIDISHWTVNGQPRAIRLKKICPVCNLVFHTEERDIGEQTTCSKGCSNTFFRSKENHPNWKDNPISSYRIKAISYYGSVCNKCGYSANKAAIVVHHKDKNRLNNSIDNLEVLCANCHAITHYT